MATANFCYRDTLYAIDDTECEFLYDDTVSNIKGSLDQFKDMRLVICSDRDEWDNCGRFSGLVVVEVSKSIMLESLISEEGIEIMVEQQIILRSGYYGGINLDRYIEINYDYTTYECEDELVDHLKDIIHSVAKYDQLYIKEHFDDEDEYYDHIETTVKDELEELLVEAQKEIDTIYHTLGKNYFDEYTVKARFSNGETIYEKA